MVDSVLVISGFGVPPYSARGLSQTLTPIDQAKSIRRTVNGDLVDLSLAQFRKYSSEITCSDQQPPAFAGLWPGQLVDVDCVAELVMTSGGTAERDIVSGSEREESGFTFYRPRLTMRVTSYSMQRDEYGAITQWTLSLEEV